MLIASARTAAVLSIQIDAITARIAAIDLALANSATIAGGVLSISDPTIGGTEITLVPQTIADTATILETMKTILETRLSTLNTSLSALS